VQVYLGEFSGDNEFVQVKCSAGKMSGWGMWGWQSASHTDADTHRQLSTGYTISSASRANNRTCEEALKNQLQHYRIVTHTHAFYTERLSLREL